MTRSGNIAVTVTVSTLDALFVDCILAQVHATDAEFCRLAAALAATFTLRVIDGAAPPAPVAAVVTQVTTCAAALHVQPVPAPLANDNPAGSVSVTVTVPDDDAVPMLPPLNVYSGRMRSLQTPLQLQLFDVGEIQQRAAFCRSRR